jgi:YVTN family beta-propeller protein
VGILCRDPYFEKVATSMNTPSLFARFALVLGGTAIAATAVIPMAGAASSPQATWKLQAPIAVGPNPAGVVVDRQGNVWVVTFGIGNLGQGTIQEIPRNATIAATPIPISEHPDALAISAQGNLWFPEASGMNNSVMELPHGSVIPLAPVTVGSGPYGLAFDKFGNLWVANYWANTVSEIKAGQSTASAPIAVGDGPSFIATDKAGNVWVTNYGSNTVSEIKAGQSTASAPIRVGSEPSGIAVDAKGHIWVANSGSGTIQEVGTKIVIKAGRNRKSSPWALAFDHRGDLWVTLINGVQELPSGSKTMRPTIVLGANSNETSVAVDASNNIWITEGGRNAVRELRYEGIH